MAPIYKIALIQFDPKPLDLEGNFAYAAKSIREAAAAGAHLAVVPEYHLTSWVPEQAGFVAASAASGAFLDRYRALARELDICIVPGTIVEAHRVGESRDTASPKSTLVTSVADGEAVELRNMAYFIEAGTGDVIGRYQKVNLWHTERNDLTAPTREAAAVAGSTVSWPPHVTFDLPWSRGQTADGEEDRPLRAGLLVCWDVAFPEAFRALVADGADLIVIPSFWGTSDVDAEALGHNADCELLFLRSALVARAYENTCAVAFCNAGGATQLAQPIVGGRGELLPGENRTSIVELDVDLLRIAESNYKVRADMRRQGWHYEHTLVPPRT